jgi:hypothetical protein
VSTEEIPGTDPITYSLEELRDLVEFGRKALPADGYSGTYDAHQRSCTVRFEWPAKRAVVPDVYNFGVWAFDAPNTILQLAEQLIDLMQQQTNNEEGGQ